MSLSVTSAPGALTVLQTLPQQTPSQPAVDTAAAAPATVASVSTTASTTISGSAQGLFATAEGVSQALTLADAADAAGQAVIGLLQQMRTAASQAANPSASASDRLALSQQVQAGAARITPTLAAATVNGVNLVDGSSKTGAKVALGDGATASLTPVDLSLGGSTLDGAVNASMTTSDEAASTVASLGGTIGRASAGLATLQTQADQISAHASFVQTLGQALAAPAVTSTDDDGDSMRLLALQVSQQLSTQSSAIANQSPQAILSLFRS